MNLFRRGELALALILMLVGIVANGQNVLSYAGGSGKTCFYDIKQLHNGNVLVCGYADNLDWIDQSIPKTELSYSGNIPNSLGANRYGILLLLTEDLQTLLHVVHFPQGAVEDIRFIKTNSLPYEPVENLYISCNTADTDNNNGGYIIAKLNGNFVNSTPDMLENYNVVWAKSYAKLYHPWDVNGLGEIFYVSGEAHGYDWSAMYALDAGFNRKVVNNWRTHWRVDGSEWYGSPASSHPSTSPALNYSGIVFKIWNRCELRSWNWDDFNQIFDDENGGTKKGKWPADFLFNSPCDPYSPSAEGPGYNGYSAEACCPVWGASSVCIDRRNGDVFLGMNFKSYSVEFNSPDFEPAVIKMDSSGALQWWSRLYHEISPQGDTSVSLPDQYIDALGIDYSTNQLVVGARSHGNNTVNLWNGNQIFDNPGAHGFKNQFTGTQGDIHVSWLGKLRLDNGKLRHSTYVAEMSEATGNLGTTHPDPNLDGWPDPNTGWPNLNTTYIAKNALKVSSSGEVCLAGKGRRTITTTNAWQKMVKPFYGGSSCWNDFVRVYDSEFNIPLYSSLVVGVWDTLSQAGGANTNIFGVHKANGRIYFVGEQLADEASNPIGNPIPIVQVPTWGRTEPINNTAIIGYYSAPELNNIGDGPSQPLKTSINQMQGNLKIWPNPAGDIINIQHLLFDNLKLEFFDLTGQRLNETRWTKGDNVNISNLPSGIIIIKVSNEKGYFTFNKIVHISSK
jgi:hypothetical protein